jgi:hypothetical protein
MDRRSKPRFRLLIYERMWQRWATPCILIVPGSVVLWLFAPRIPHFYAPSRVLALAPALVALLILAYAHLARKMAWVQCRPNHLRIQTPLYPLTVSYSRIKSVRPNTFAQVFDPAKQRGTRRNWLVPYWNRTVVVVEVSRYPLGRAWLRLWFSPYLLSPEVTGFVFLVEDWMALSRQLEDSRTNWETRRTARRQELLARQVH